MELSNPNSKPPIVGGEMIKVATPRQATPNLYHTQFLQAMMDTFQRLNYQFQGTKWDIETGETVDDDGIMLFVNIWADGQPMMPLMHVYQIEDKREALIEAWRDMFKRFQNLVNDRDARIIQKLTSRLVRIGAQRAKKLKAEADSKRLEESRSKGLRDGSDRLREDETG